MVRGKRYLAMLFGACIFAFGLLSVGAPMAFAATQATTDHVPVQVSDTSCGTTPPVYSISIKTLDPGSFLPLRPVVVSVSTDQCTLSYLVQKGDPNQIALKSDGNIPEVSLGNQKVIDDLGVLKITVVNNAQTMWQMGCPHGVFFSTLLPSYLAINPIIYQQILQYGVSPRTFSCVP